MARWLARPIRYGIRYIDRLVIVPGLQSHIRRYLTSYNSQIVMPHRLPTELWAQIVSYLEEDGTSLTNCARVCRQWQPIFEQLIYRSVEVESEQLQSGSRLLSFSQIQTLVSDANRCRQCFVRRLQYTVIMPIIFQTMRRQSLRVTVSRMQSER